MIHRYIYIAGTPYPASPGLAAAIGGASHALMRNAQITSVPESPTLLFLLFAKEYTAFRRRSFASFIDALRAAIPDSVTTLDV